MSKVMFTGSPTIAQPSAPFGRVLEMVRAIRASVPKSRIPSLDGLRAISIGVVLFSHATVTANFPIQDPTLRSYLVVGDLGVRVFFVISGYLITTLLLRELKSTGGIQLRRFYFRRTLRIFPPFYLFLAVLFLLKFVGVLTLTPGDNPVTYLSAVFYFKNYVDSDWYLGHAWSLSVEEQFYILWPTLLLLGRKRAFWIAAATLIVCPIIRGYYVAYQPLTFGTAYRFESVADAIAIGCLLAASQQRLRQSRLYRALQTSKGFFLIPLAAVVAELTSVRTHIGPVNYGFFGMLASYSVMNVAIVLSIDWCLANPDGRVGKLLNTRFLSMIGVWSYSIYIWQQVFLDQYSALLSLPWNLLPILPVALLSYYFIERPSLRLRSRLEPRLFPSRRPVSQVVPETLAA